MLLKAFKCIAGEHFRPEASFAMQGTSLACGREGFNVLLLTCRALVQGGTQAVDVCCWGGTGLLEQLWRQIVPITFLPVL